MQKLKKQISEKNFENVYLFHGEEEYLKALYLNKIEDKLELGDMAMMNKDSYIGHSVEAREILDSISTLPVFTQYRLVVVKDSGLFVAGRKNETDKLVEHFEELSSTTILIFVEENVDKRNKLYKTVNKIGSCVDFTSLKEADLIKWVEGLFKKNNLQIQRKVTLKILNTVNRNMNNIEIEVNKLVSFIESEDRELTIEDVNNICSKSLELKIFDLVSAIGKKDPVVALDIYNNMVLMKESPIMILSMIARQLKILLQCKYLKDLGYTNASISKELGLPSFVIKECVTQSKNFNKLELYKSIDRCLGIDVDIKTGNINDKLGVETLILEYSC